MHIFILLTTHHCSKRNIFQQHSEFEIFSAYSVDSSHVSLQNILRSFIKLELTRNTY